MLTTILIVVAVVIVAALVYAALQPNTFSITRSIAIAAPPERIFLLVNDLRSHRKWSPFDQDAAMKRAYSGPESGPGATFAFDGGNKSGVGTLAVTDAQAPSRVTMSLKMTKPMSCNNVVEFAFLPQGAMTQTSWTMHGPQPFLAKVMNRLLRCDKMCARQFDQGLAALKAAAER
jgi:uncharacterized protein YndB with AHSA1/START domain